MSQISIKGGSVTGVIKTIIPEAGDNVNPNGTGEITLTGINDITITGNAATQTVDISLSGTTEHAVQIGDATGGIESLAVGTDGQVLIAASGGAPAFATLTSSGGTITFTPGANTLNLEAAGDTGAVDFVTDSGTATEVGHTINILGGTNINTAGATDEVTINLDTDLTGISSVTTSTGGALRTGTTAADTLLLRAYDVDGTAYKTFATLTANNMPTMDLDTDVTLGTKYIYRADGTDVPVTDGGTGASTLTQYGVLVGNGTSAVGALAVGSTGQGLMGSTGANPVWTGSPSFSGTVTAGTGVTATTGNVTVSAGNVTLPATNGAGTEGIVKIGGIDAIKTYGTNNLFLGPVGNTTLTTATAIMNTIINGSVNATGITTANRNLAAGYNAGDSLTEGASNTLLSGGASITTGSYNTMVGFSAGSRPTTGTYNTMLGYAAGTTNTTVAQTSNVYIASSGVLGESHVMRLGNDGTSDNQIDTVVIAGTNATISGAATAGTVNIATGAAAKTVTLGSTNTTSKLDLKFGTADFSLASATGNVIVAQDTGEVTKPLQPAFLAIVNASVTDVTGDGTTYTLIGNTEIFDQNSDYDTGTGIFTAPVTARYLLTVRIGLAGLLSTHVFARLEIATSNRSHRLEFNPYNFSSSGTICTANSTNLVDMDAGDTAYCTIQISGGTKVVDISGAASADVSSFSGYLAV